MSVTITPLGIKIGSGAGFGLSTGAGNNRGTEIQGTLNQNGVYDPNTGTLYVVYLDFNTDNLHIIASTDAGATWSDIASTASSSRQEFIDAVIVGTKLWISYAQGSTSSIVFIRSFDLNAHTWGGEVSKDVSGAPFFLLNPEGPYDMYVRPDGIIMCLFRSLDESPCYCFYVAFDPTAGTWGNPTVIFDQSYPTPPNTSFPTFNADALGSDGTAHLIFSNNFNQPIYYVEIAPDGTVSAPVNVSALVPALNLIVFNTGLVGPGVVDGSDLYFPIGIKTADFPTVWGNIGILARIAGTWSFTPVLLPSATEQVLQTPLMMLIDGTFVLTYLQLDAVTYTNYATVVGYATKANYAIPGAWTWQTVYDYTTPVPAVPGAVAPYTPSSYLGNTTAMSLAADGQTIRILQNFKDNTGASFIALLMSIKVGSSAPAVPPVILMPGYTVILPDPKLCRVTQAPEFQREHESRPCIQYGDEIQSTCEPAEDGETE